MANDIPLVDFRPFLENKDKEVVASQIAKALKDFGLFYLVNHGIAKEKVDGIFSVTKQFFDLPMEKKQTARHPDSATYHRGYSAPGREKLTQHVYDTEEIAQLRTETVEAKESYESGSPDNLLLPNIWPPDDVFPGFQESCLEFYEICRELHLSFMRALAIGLNLPEDHFFPFHRKNENQLRLLHYLSTPIEDVKKGAVALAGAHSDFGLCTFLFQDGVGGLQYEDWDKPGTFQDVPPVPGSIVVNAADLLSRWTNDQLKSPVHRVTCPTSMNWPGGMTPERYSVPYFCGPDSDALIECLPGTWDASTPKLYEPITAGEYIVKRLAVAY